MKPAVLLALVALSVVTTPAVPLAPDLPTKPGYCVTVEDESGVTLGITFTMGKADPQNVERFRGEVGNAVRLIGIKTDRQDIVQAADLIALPLSSTDAMRRRPGAPIGGTGSCQMVCYCATLSQGGTTAASGFSCGGGCKDCERCRLVCPPGVSVK